MKNVASLNLSVNSFPLAWKIQINTSPALKPSSRQADKPTSRQATSVPLSMAASSSAASEVTIVALPQTDAELRYMVVDGFQSAITIGGAAALWPLGHLHRPLGPFFPRFRTTKWVSLGSRAMLGVCLLPSLKPAFRPTSPLKI